MTSSGKAQSASWFIETKSDVQTQQNYRTKYGRDQLPRSSMRLWHKKFMKTGTEFDSGRSGRLRTFEENIERVGQAFYHSHMKFIRSYAINALKNVMVGLFHTYFCRFAGSKHLILSQ